MTPEAGNAREAAAPALLEIEGIEVSFGGIKALQSISFTVEVGRIVGLIGPNGAGKTTLFNCLSRIYTPNAGAIRFEGQPILSLPRHRISRLGIARTLQNVALFDRMSVFDNVLVGGHIRGSSGFVANALRLPSTRAEDARLREAAEDLVAFMKLDPYRDSPAGELPFPIRKRVELARALMTKPKLLLLDEPAAGLNHDEVEVLKAQISEIRDREKLTILLVEHHMQLVMSVSDKVVVIDFGKKIAEGTPAQVSRDETVIRAYLGSD